MKLRTAIKIAKAESCLATALLERYTIGQTMSAIAICNRKCNDKRMPRFMPTASQYEWRVKKAKEIVRRVMAGETVFLSEMRETDA